MEITGVQTVGARSLGSVSATVSDPTVSSGRANVGAPEREIGTATSRTLYAEAVAFPRDGKPLDRRPVQLRQQRAQARYRDDGSPRDGRGQSD
jgi:hypothetical protein